MRKRDEFLGIQWSGFRILFDIIFIFTQNVENEMSSLNFHMAVEARRGATEAEQIHCYESIECF